MSPLITDLMYIKRNVFCAMDGPEVERVRAGGCWVLDCT